MNAPRRFPKAAGGKPPAKPDAPAKSDAAPPVAPWKACFEHWPAAALLVATRLAFWRISPLAAEDAYITLRYAARFAEGRGLTYNDGERVMGFTSPLWTLWCSLGALLGDAVLWARLGSLVADLVTLGCFTALLMRHASRPAPWIFAAFFAVWPFFAAISGTGLEMSAMLAVLALTVWLVDARHPVGAGVAAGALALMRPEGIASAVVLGLWMSNRSRWIAAAIFAAGAGALAAYFGSPIPQSLLSKAMVYGTPGPAAGLHWWDWLLPFELGRWPTLQEGLHLFALRILLIPAFAVGLWKCRRNPLGQAGLACLVVLAGYATLGVTYFFWYMTLPLAGVILLAAAGLPEIVKGKVVYVTAALLLAGTWTTQPGKVYGVRSKIEELRFGGIGTQLASRAAPGEKVFLEPIGIIGYRARQVSVLDETGLVTPEVAARRREGAGWYSDLVKRHRPEWIVIRYGVFAKMTQFAGVGAPFRNEAELDSVLAIYEPLYTTSRDPTADDFAIARRLKGR